MQAIEEISWERDQWSRGGYAYFSKSFDPGWRDVLARAFGRVLFAGDHTSREHQGYMEGAVESGHRVATELAQLEKIRRLTLTSSAWSPTRLTRPTRPPDRPDHPDQL